MQAKSFFLYAHLCPLSADLHGTARKPLELKKEDCFPEESAVPLYEYRCTSCGYSFEKIQSFSAAPESVCPKCQGVLIRPVTAPALRFEGAGWYVNDYAGKAAAKTEAASAAGESAGGTEAKSEAKSDAKSDPVAGKESAAAAPVAAPAASPAPPASAVS